MAEEGRANERLREDRKAGGRTVPMFINKIVEQCREVLERHKSLSVEEYLKDGRYRDLELEMMSVKVQKRAPHAEGRMPNAQRGAVRRRHFAYIWACRDLFVKCDRGASQAFGYFSRHPFCLRSKRLPLSPRAKPQDTETASKVSRETRDA